jgi:hypothetical protein
MDNAADNPPIVRPLRTREAGRQMRLDQRPLFIAQNNPGRIIPLRVKPRQRGTSPELLTPGSAPDNAYLVLTRVIESDCQAPSTRAEIVVLFQSINPLHDVLMIRERSNIVLLQNIKPAAVAALYRAS